MAVTWSPLPVAVTDIIHAWGDMPDTGLVETHIADAVIEVVAGVDSFDPDEQIAGPSEVTLGDLAKRAAALRAAYTVVVAVYPEQGFDAAESTRSQLYARYRDAMEQLAAHVRIETDRGGAFGVQPSY